MAYNMTWMDNATTLPQVFSNVNTNSGQLIGILIMIVTFMLIFAAFKNFDTIHALIVTSFISTLIAVLFWYMNIVSFLIVTVFFTLAIFMIIYNYFVGS